MELHLTALEVHGVIYRGFPVIFDDQMRMVQPAFDYLADRCIGPGYVREAATREAYGRALYDFLGYLFANGIDWRWDNTFGTLHPIIRYRDWSLARGHICEATLRLRLTKVIDYYMWCAENGYVSPNQLIGRSASSIARRSAKACFRKAPLALEALNVRPQPAKPPKFLTADQITALLRCDMRTAYKLICKLALLCGLRSCEIRSFPASYVVNPQELPDKLVFRTALNTRDMHIKFRKPRSIDIPRTLMSELWDYLVLHRTAHLKDKSQKELLITTAGRPFSASAMQYVFKVVSKASGISVHPHMLRHSYATHTLQALRDKGLKEQAIFYVRNRMGHSSVKYTERYLHLVDDEDVRLSQAFADSLDAMLEKNDG